MKDNSDDIGKETRAKIYVVGVGGCGCNAINTMAMAGAKGVKLIACNTDCQSLTSNKAAIRIQIGKDETNGLGAGADPTIGARAATESLPEIQSALEDADMVFVTAGMGGGTGTGAAPIIADTAKKMGILTIGVVTMPFSFEGKHRRRVAEFGLQSMIPTVDTILTIPNDALLKIEEAKKTGALQGFQLTDKILRNAVIGISEIILETAHINLDFADICRVTRNKKSPWSVICMGEATGTDCALEAVKKALGSPLLEHIDVKNAQGALACFHIGNECTLAEYADAMEYLTGVADEEALVISGITGAANLEGHACRVEIILTGLNPPNSQTKSLKSPSFSGRVSSPPIIPTDNGTPVSTDYPPRVSRILPSPMNSLPSKNPGISGSLSPLPPKFTYGQSGFPRMAASSPATNFSEVGTLPTPLSSLPPTASQDALAAMEGAMKISEAPHCALAPEEDLSQANIPSPKKAPQLSMFAELPTKNFNNFNRIARTSEKNSASADFFLAGSASSGEYSGGESISAIASRGKSREQATSQSAYSPTSGKLTTRPTGATLNARINVKFTNPALQKK